MNTTLPAPRGSQRASVPHDRTTEDTVSTGWALAARAGDREAADAFVRALHRDVVRYVAHLSADPQAAEDLAQDTFLRALRTLHRFEGRSSARTWLLTIARRAVVDDFRRTAARPLLADTDDWSATVERAQPTGLPGFEEGVALQELLAALPYDRRQAFVLTQLLGLSYAEAARAAGCPVGTVRSRVARARTALTAQLEHGEAEALAQAA
ncbi:RNA polymerase sigma factor [Streptomyces gelaticus]|uniref:RNA polymerase sigma factor n=1 Tax=Streptomyces gelaticus TaxID=285446 RepID=A0ABQ2VVL3_9ACTN|nr:sigma-70 family RNA polymerase sigma factor [Streptomyces gelaticus]GGV81104.1 RNA polymerase sigma factor [Streptomyces gelaticus]